MEISFSWALSWALGRNHAATASNWGVDWKPAASDLIEFVIQFVVLFLQTSVLAFQTVIFYGSVSDAVAKHGVADDEHQNDDSHEACDDDNCQCIHITYI